MTLLRRRKSALRHSRGANIICVVRAQHLEASSCGSIHAGPRPMARISILLVADLNAADLALYAEANQRLTAALASVHAAAE